MNTKRIPFFSLFFILLPVVLLCTSLPRLQSSTDHLPPTEILERKLAKKSLRIERERWFEEMHRTPPQVDWRVIEHGNALVKMGQKNGIDWLSRIFPDAHWQETGSRNQSGRVNTTVIVANAQKDSCQNSQTSGNERPIGGNSSKSIPCDQTRSLPEFLAGHPIYLGAPNGIWKLEDERWQALSDRLSLENVRNLFITDREGTRRIVVVDQTKIFYSDDEGTTWFEPKTTFAGMKFVDAVIQTGTGRIFVLTSEPAISLTAGMLSVFMSEDNAEHFVKIGSIEGSLDTGRLWISRTNEASLYALFGYQLFRFTPGGTWTKISSVDPDPNFPSDNELSDVHFCASEAGGPTFYAFLRPKRDDDIGKYHYIYRSDEAGKTWSYSGKTDQWIWRDGRSVDASITDQNRVMFGGIELFKSDNGGQSFKKQNDWWDYYDKPGTRLHADIPEITSFIADGAETILVSTDGGLYLSRDALKTVENLSLDGLNINRYYSTLTHKDNQRIIFAGAQDQGLQRSEVSAKERSLDNFDQIISGDYGHLSSANGGDDLFAVYPGFILYLSDATKNEQTKRYDFKEISEEEHSWMPFIAADPEDPHSCLFLADSIYRVTYRYGWSSTQLSTILTPEKGEYLTALAIAPSDKNYWYAVSNKGSFFFSLDGGETWSKSTGSTQLNAHYFYGTAITVSPENPEILAIGGSNYSEKGSAVLLSKNHGLGFLAINNGLPKTLALGLTFAMKLGEDHGLFAATTSGPYLYNPNDNRWIELSQGSAPIQVYWSVEYLEQFGLVRFGTHGRGIWDLVLD